MSAGSNSAGSTSRHPSSRTAAATSASSASASSTTRTRDPGAAPTPTTGASAPSSRVSTRGAATGNSANLGLRAMPGRTSRPAPPAPAATAAVTGASTSSSAPTGTALASNPKRKRGEQVEDEPSDAIESMHLSKAPLVTLTSVPLFYTPPASASTPDPQPHLVRLIRVHNHGTHASATAAVHSAAGASTSAAAAAAAAAGVVTESYVRASDLCLTFLQSKSSVHNQVRDFNQPYEKCLMRINYRGGEVCCLTRRGVQRLVQTSKVRALPHLAAWIQNVLLCLMRPGNEGMDVPIEALRGSSAGQSEAAAEAAHAREDEAAATAPAGEDQAAAQATLAAALLSLPPPSDAQLAAWVRASLTLATSTLRGDEERAAKLAAVAAALPSQQPGGSSAGKDWVGEGAACKYEGRHTRMGPRYQAVLPELFTPQQQSADIGLRFEDEQVFDPFDPPAARLAPFRPWPVVAPTDPNSRRAKRILYDMEARRTRRMQQAMEGNGGAGGDGPAPSALDSIHGATAVLIERQLALMQREERERLEAKLLESAFNKAKSKSIKKDLGLRDFEQSLLSLFIPEGNLRRVFSEQLPDPRSIAESFDVMAASFVPTKELLAAQKESLTRSQGSSLNRGKRRRTDGDNDAYAGASSGAAATPVHSLASMAAAAAASGAHSMFATPTPTAASAGALASGHSASAAVAAPSSSSGWHSAGASLVPLSTTPASASAAAAAASDGVASGLQPLTRRGPGLNPVRLPAAVLPRSPLLPIDLAQSASLRRRVQTLQQREPGRTHFPQSASSGTGAAAAPPVSFSSATIAAPNPHLSLRLPRAASGIHAALGLRSTATAAPPSLAKAHQLMTAAR